MGDLADFDVAKAFEDELGDAVGFGVDELWRVLVVLIARERKRDRERERGGEGKTERRTSNDRPLLDASYSSAMTSAFAPPWRRYLRSTSSVSMWPRKDPVSSSDSLTMAMPRRSVPWGFLPRVVSGSSRMMTRERAWASAMRRFHQGSSFSLVRGGRNGPTMLSRLMHEACRAAM